MLYQFTTPDGETFVLNTETMRWGKASTILSAPSVAAVEGGITQFMYSEEGDLVPQGGGTYNLDGRRKGVTTAGILAIPWIDTLYLRLHTNAPIVKESFKSNPIKNFHYEASFNEAMEQSPKKMG